MNSFNVPRHNQGFRVAVDLDGTIIRMNDLVADLINFRHGVDHDATDFSYWGWLEDNGYGEDLWDAYDFADEIGARVGCGPYDGDVVDVLEVLSMVYDTDIVTCNGEEVVSQMWDWFNIYSSSEQMDVFLEQLDIRTIGRVDVNNKLDLEYDLYIDDSPNLINDIPDHPESLVLVMNAPWNEPEALDIDLDDYANAVRVRSWEEVYDIVTGVASEQTVTA
jgi:hypothetical protein